jgi:hypothetical protein
MLSLTRVGHPLYENPQTVSTEKGEGLWVSLKNSLTSTVGPVRARMGGMPTRPGEAKREGTLRVTPVMEAGITDHISSIQEIVDLMQHTEKAHV